MKSADDGAAKDKDVNSNGALAHVMHFSFSGQKGAFLQ
jgi:hypothetical protein